MHLRRITETTEGFGDAGMSAVAIPRSIRYCMNTLQPTIAASQPASVGVGIYNS
ncbi:MAG: hypothetical protein WAK17_13335 [Candidatus Nitrosopolaris sp.]